MGEVESFTLVDKQKDSTANSIHQKKVHKKYSFLTQRISKIRVGARVASPMSVVRYVTEGKSRRTTHPELERRRVFQKFIFPIPPTEREKFYYFAILAFLIFLGNFNLSGIRDALVVTAPHSNATIIVYLRCFGSLPLGLLFITLFSWCVNRISRRVLFNFLFLANSAFLIIFPFAVYPEIALYQPSPQHIQDLIQMYPHAEWFVVIYGNWLICLYYLVADLWLGISFTLLFWQLANQVVTTPEAKQFYPIFISIGGFGAFVSGIGIVWIVNSGLVNLSNADQAWQDTFQTVSFFSVVSFALAVLVHVLLWRRPFMRGHDTSPKSLPSTSAFEGFHYLWKNKYLRCLFFIILAHEMIYEFTALLWKTEVAQLNSTPSGYNYFLSNARIWEGLSVAIIGYGSKSLIEKFGWKFAAYLAPSLAILSVSIFMVPLILKMWFPYFSMLSEVSVYLGAFNSIFLMLIGYAFVYTTKEMAYIPLSTDMKVKGKTAVDVLSYNLANGGSAGIDTLLTAYFATSVLVTLPYVSFLVFGLFVLWIMSVKSLAPLYQARIMAAKDR